MEAFDLFLREYEQAYVIVSSAFEQFVKRLLFLSTVDPP